MNYERNGKEISDYIYVEQSIVRMSKLLNYTFAVQVNVLILREVLKT